MFRKKEEDEVLEKNLGHESGNFMTTISGIIIFCIGAYLIMQNTIITTGFSLSRIFGFTPNFGLVVMPFLIGIVIIFFNKNSILGWFLIVAGVMLILVGTLMGLRFYFKPITMFRGLIMFGITAAGIGITLKGIIGRGK